MNKKEITQKLEKLYEDIKNWGIKNGIIQNAKVNIQFLKTISEKSEITKAILDENVDEIIDGIGDTFVTFVMVVEIIKRDLDNQNIKLNFDNIINYKMLESHIYDIACLDVELGNAADCIAKNQLEKTVEYINNSLLYLTDLANKFDTQITNCIQVAYDEIKDREGFLTPDGTFVKSTDENYQEIINKYKKD